MLMTSVRDYTTLTRDDIVFLSKPHDLVKRSGVYFFVSGGDVQYVGQTQNLYARLWVHEKLRRDHHVAFIDVPQREVINEVEHYYIKQFQPSLNTQGVSSPYKPSRRV